MSEMLDQAVKHLSSREDMSRAGGALGCFLHQNDAAALARFRSQVACLPNDCDGVINGYRLALRDVAAAYQAELEGPQRWISPLDSKTAHVELPAGCSVRVTALGENLRLETGYVSGPDRPEYVTVTATIDRSRLCHGCEKEVKEDAPRSTDLGELIHPECRPRSMAIRRFWKLVGPELAPHHQVFLSTKPLPLANVSDVDGKAMFEGSPIDESFLFWIDEEPDANWSHPCSFVIVMTDGSGWVRAPGGWPPVEAIYDKLEKIERHE